MTSRFSYLYCSRTLLLSRRLDLRTRGYIFSIQTVREIELTRRVLLF